MGVEGKEIDELRTGSFALVRVLIMSGEEEGHTLRGRSLRMRMVRKSLRSSSTLTPSCRSSDTMLTTAPGHHNDKGGVCSIVAYSRNNATIE